MNPLQLPEIEYRASEPVRPIQLRVSGGGPVRLIGLDAVFNRPSKNLGGFIEQVGEHAFDRSRDAGWPDVIARFNHSDAFILATAHVEDRSRGTLRLSTTPDGLRYEIDMPRSRRDISELVLRKDVRHSSFAFRTIKDEWTTTASGYPLRTLTDVELVDVSPVVLPAYPDTTTALRSLSIAADADPTEVRQLAEADALHLLWAGTSRPQPTRRGALIGAARRLQLEKLAVKATG